MVEELKEREIKMAFFKWNLRERERDKHLVVEESKEEKRVKKKGAAFSRV